MAQTLQKWGSLEAEKLAFKNFRCWPSATPAEEETPRNLSPGDFDPQRPAHVTVNISKEKENNEKKPNFTIKADEFSLLSGPDAYSVGR